MKMKKSLIAIGLLAIVSLNLLSCNKSIIRPNKEKTEVSPKVNPEKRTLVGVKKVNPFTVTNMQNAYSSLNNTRPNGEIVCNKKYVRFQPADASQCKKLEDDGLILFTTPLDYEILEYGNSSSDPQAVSNGNTWLYTTVNVNYNYGNIVYEVLDNLFLPDEPNTVQFTKFSPDQLIDKSLELCGYLDEATSQLKATRYNPTGYIKV